MQATGHARTCSGISTLKRASDAHRRFSRMTYSTLWISPLTQFTALGFTISMPVGDAAAPDAMRAATPSITATLQGRSPGS